MANADVRTSIISLGKGVGCFYIIRDVEATSSMGCAVKATCHYHHDIEHVECSPPDTRHRAVHH